ncbi:MAG: hypothetical protein HPPSJP_4650 [Candidatus Hepatoplasma scabrum]|nr:MAG: hypothetical protein HPPSJP_4650 [Candidatus Hepatoplasma sp.]
MIVGSNPIRASIVISVKFIKKIEKDNFLYKFNVMKYYIGIDESGITSNHLQKIYKVKLSKKFNKNEIVNFITLVLFNKETFDYLNFKVKQFKIQYFKSEKFIFHSYEFFNFKLRYDKNYQLYIYKFLNLLESQNFKIYQIKIDIDSLYNKYKEKTIDPYFNAIKFFFNKLFFDSFLLNSDIFIETRGQYLDYELLNSFKLNLKYNNLLFLQKNIKFIDKKDEEHYLIIEIADLISYLERWFNFHHKPFIKNHFYLDQIYFYNYLIKNNYKNIKTNKYFLFKIN